MNGKTRARILSEEQLARYRPCFDNTRRLKALLAMLEAASVAAAEQAEAGPHRQTTAASRPPPGHLEQVTPTDDPGRDPNPPPSRDDTTPQDYS